MFQLLPVADDKKQISFERCAEIYCYSEFHKLNYFDRTLLTTDFCYFFICGCLLVQQQTGNTLISVLPFKTFLEYVL